MWVRGCFLLPGFFFFFPQKDKNLYLATPDPRCNMRGLQLQHVGSGSPTRSRTRAPWMGNVGSQPLDHQRSAPTPLPGLDGSQGGGAQEDPSGA